MLRLIYRVIGALGRCQKTFGWSSIEAPKIDFSFKPRFYE